MGFVISAEQEPTRLHKVFATPYYETPCQVSPFTWSNLAPHERIAASQVRPELDYMLQGPDEVTKR